jgi:hypothetical protein
MITLEKDGNIVEVESTNEFAITRWQLRGYTIVE